jgi:hypothetical protein
MNIHNIYKEPSVRAFKRCSKGPGTERPEARLLAPSVCGLSSGSSAAGGRLVLVTLCGRWRIDKPQSVTFVAEKAPVSL